MLSDWNKFVQKIYREGKSSNPEYKFKNALKDASARKSEMGSVGVATTSKKTRRFMNKRMSKKAKRSSIKSCIRKCKTKKMKGGKKGGCVKHALMPADFPGDQQ